MSDAKGEYRKQMATGASPQRLVVLLYEQLIQDLHRAATAIDQNRIEQRTNELEHALLVVGELQARLDSKQGAEISANLDRYYAVLRRCLLEAQFAGSKKILLAQIAHLVSLREAWLEVERAVSPPTSVATTGTGEAHVAAPQETLSDWKA